jgi:hypothetical protein
VELDDRKSLKSRLNRTDTVENGVLGENIDPFRAHLRGQARICSEGLQTALFRHA